MYQFNYKKVETVQEAVNELSANPESKILAGGMTLIPTMKQRLASPEQLIDIRNIEELNFRGLSKGVYWINFNYIVGPYRFTAIFVFHILSFFYMADKNIIWKDST